MSIDDPSILNGVSTILNKQNMDQSVRYNEIEKSMVESGCIAEPDNPSDEFKNELKELSDKLGISLEDGNTNLESQLMNAPSNVQPMSSYTTPQVNDEDSGSYSYSSDSDDESNMPLPAIPAFATTSLAIPKTEEEERRSITQGVVSELSSESTSKLFSLEKERREHERGIKLEKIDELRRTLESEKIDLANVPGVTRNSKDEEIDYALKILILKNDRIRFHTVAEEMILLGAYGLEEIFDGNRVWLGKYRPDLQGWHTHVSSKLRRMRYDTSTLVSNVMSEYNIGSMGRILLELVPNAFMYSRKKSKSKGSETLYSQEQADAARSGIRDRDEPF
jgi:hypothetical protein